MQLIRKYNKGIQFLLCVIDIFSKHVCVVYLEHKKRLTITRQRILDKSNRKPIKIWVDKDSEFYNQ